jgi:hypothetical protein
MTIIACVLRCLFNKPDVADLMKGIEVVYPTDYDLQNSLDMGNFGTNFFALLELVGNCPKTETLYLQRYFRTGMTGLDDETYEIVDDEIEEYVDKKAQEKEDRKDMMAEAGPQAMAMGVNGMPTTKSLIAGVPDEATAEAQPADEDQDQSG